MNNIVRCPHCIEKTNIAEVLPNGDIKILRFVKEDERSWGGNEQIIYSTIVRAEEYSLICGNCQNVVVFKKQMVLTPQVNIMLTWGTMLNYYENNNLGS